jgi:type II secretory ATPase GspE/PulE/Tfp pilus assembly ATPase PilB-like protein/CRP-like cAMP-binding protein
MAINTKSEVIKSCKLFQGCTSTDIKLILETAVFSSVKQGDPVFVVNDPSHYVYIVMSGAIDILGQESVRNQSTKIRTVLPTEHFSELSVLGADRHRTSAFARENSELLCVPGSDYLELIRKIPRINLNQIEILFTQYMRSLRGSIFLPVIHDVADVTFERDLLKMAPLKLPAARRAIPLRVESNVVTVGFCLPISTEIIESVRLDYPGYEIKFVVLETSCYEPLRKIYLNFLSGQAGSMLPTPNQTIHVASDHDADLEDLQSSTLMLSQLPTESFNNLKARFKIEDFAQGDVIFDRQNSSDRFYFIGLGQVELSKNVDALRVQVTCATVDQYDIFFDTTLFSSDTSQLTAIARSTCRLFSLSRAEFIELINLPEFAVHFSITLAHMINNLNKAITEFELYARREPELDLHTRPIMPLSKIKKSKIVPLQLMDKDLTIGMLMPKRELLDEAIDSYLRGFNVKMCLITEEDFDRWTMTAPGTVNFEQTVTVFRNSDDDTRLLQIVSPDPIAALDEILAGAITSRASDIHFEPNEKSLVVRYRIDGVITQLWDYIPAEIGLSILRRLKILAEMDISESRLPQDGQFSFKKNEIQSSFRVSSVPTRYGEKLVLRTTSRKNSVVPLQLLAPNTKITKFLNRLTKYQQGIFFITGPTGSGKSTTLYSILSELNTRDKNIITIEDPIEANLSGINQIEINPSIGLTHESILRNVLRQDPDVIMIGEIRDAVSMQLALDAALAGHLVLTTIHAGNTFEVIPRIKELGGSTSHIASSLIGVIAQRLVRRLCPCKKPRAVTAKEQDLFKDLDFSEPLTHIMESVGCGKCNYTGFSGQLPVFEFWEKTMNVHNVLMDEGRSEEVMEAIRGSNFESLTAYGLRMVAQGLTTMSEVNDVLFGIADLMAS